MSKFGLLRPSLARFNITELFGKGDQMPQIHESAENYLKNILILSRRNGNVRSIDIVNEMDFTKPSVSIAMKNLREKGLILMSKEGYITLTDEGRAIAEKTYDRYTLLVQWLTYLGVSEETAEEDACRIEHVISDESFNAIREHLDAALSGTAGKEE